MMPRALLAALLLAAFAAQAQDAGALRARHAALREAFAASAFGRPLHVESAVSGSSHQGEVYAVLEHPFRVVASVLANPAQWCEILTLQVNIKRCEPFEQGISAYVTRRPRDPVESAYQVQFAFGVVGVGPEYVRVALAAPSGPLGTRDYRIRVQAAALSAERTFIHMSYAYALGFWARLAMDAYLSGSGRDKVGFSVAERRPDGSVVHVDGARGVVERNAMRHYLAIEAFIDSPKELEPRLRNWYDEIGRYPQLREQVGAREYVEMKLREATG